MTFIKSLKQKKAMRIIKTTSSSLFLLVLIFSAQTVVNANEQTPWQTNRNGTLCSPRTTSQDYTMGYSFRPQKDGRIIRLGGFFEGEKIVKLWNKQTGAELASALVVGKFKEWRYTDIPPVDVKAGTTYIVAAYINSSGATYQYAIEPFPQVYGDIVIENTAYARGDAKPIYYGRYSMLGQVDVAFVALEDMNTEVTITREIQKISAQRIKVTLDIQPSYYSGLKAFWMVEYIPEASNVLEASHGGVIFKDRIEWIASEFTQLSVGDTRVSYEIINEGSDYTYNGAWLCSNPQGGWHYGRITTR